MSIADTLRDISHESSLNEAEKISLRLLAKDVDKLVKENERLNRRLGKLIKQTPRLKAIGEDMRVRETI